MRWSAKSVNIFFILLFFIALLAIETILRLQGVRPGFIYQGVEEVDSLVVLPNYFADEDGVQKLRPDAVSRLNAYVSGKKELSIANIAADKVEDDLSNMVFDFYCLQHGLTGQEVEKLRDRLGISSAPEERDAQAALYDKAKFRQRIETIRASRSASAFDSLLLEYTQSPFNVQGFHSIDFNSRAPGKKRVLLLGNSFTWGKDGKPCFNSFADILLSRGYLVYNTGIVSTDPVHYVAVIKKYIDTIQPDLVLINFSINDKIHFEHEPMAGGMLYHHTNAGLLSAYPHNVYMNAQEAYQCELEQSKIPRTNFFNRLCSFSALTTSLWIFMKEKQWVSDFNPAVAACRAKGVEAAPKPVCMQYINQVLQVCGQNQVECKVVVIPDFFNYYDQYPDLSYQEVFGEVPFYQPTGFTRADYSDMPGDDHLNNSGHRKYADFLQALIDSSRQ